MLSDRRFAAAQFVRVIDSQTKITTTPIDEKASDENLRRGE